MSMSLSLAVELLVVQEVRLGQEHLHCEVGVSEEQLVGQSTSPALHISLNKPKTSSCDIKIIISQ